MIRSAYFMISGQTRAKKSNYAELPADYFGAKAGNVFQCFYREME